jgi:tetraacyldisaccharide 4'-kinase
MSKLITIHQRLVTAKKLCWWEKSLFILLLPVSFAYGVISWFRNVFYDFNVFSVYRSSLPIVSVGNITAGGTGKTPVVDWLVKEFQQIGKQPAIVSRGYSGSFSGGVGLVSDGQELLMSADTCGDEPYLLARRNRSCPVVISRKRAEGLRFLEQRDDVDIVILDDGFQHRAVKREVDLLLLDAKYPLGNGWPLPAGNLREFPGALRRADFLLMTRVENRVESSFKGDTVYHSCHQLSDIAVDLNGQAVPLDDLRTQKLLAFAGIANPFSFFNSLVSCGLTLSAELPLGDHVVYDSFLIERLNEAAKNCDAMLTTEKDGVKLIADMFELPCYQVPVDVQIEKSSELFEKIVQRIWSL